jgi:hypothetical protein
MPTKKRPPNPLRAAAAIRGETLAETASAVAVTPATLYAVSAGDRKPWPALTARLVAHFGYNPFERWADELEQAQ